MHIIKQEVHEINNELDIVLVRKLVHAFASQLKLSIVNQTKLVTAASELARNIVKYAQSGSLKLCVVSNNTGREGIQMIFEDNGPGIADIPRVMAGGYTTGGGLGLGLSGSKRLVDEFELKSIVGKGTHIKLIMWK